MVHPPTRFNGTISQGGSCITAGNPVLPGQPCASPAFQDKKKPKNCQPGGYCLWFSQGCTIGCDKCGGTNGAATCPKQQAKATLPQELRTYNVKSKDCGVNPWCAPGSAPVLDSCGLAGGDVDEGKQGNGGVPPDFYKQGFKGTEVPFGAGTASGHPVTTWKAGKTAEVAWAITANHGGGYQYRLCKRSEAQTEACFQRTPLEFANADTQWIQWGGDFNNRTQIPALTVSNGTIPTGSQWRRNPIPACGLPTGGAMHTCPFAGQAGFQFPPPGEDRARPGWKLGGFGSGACDSGLNKFTACTASMYANQMFHFSIVDQVKVPAGLSGDYVLSFRYDSEQTPQVWAGCSDITIQ